MTLLVVGLNHKTAPLTLREKLAFPEDELPRALSALFDSSRDITEAVILSTCNRTEVYASSLTAPLGLSAIKNFLCDYKGLSQDEARELEGCLYFKQAEDMVTNLFTVVSSLDSLVLGEAQILGQTRRAFMAAELCHAVGEVFTKLFRDALKVGKRVRSETSIGAQSVSVSTVAVGLAEQVFGSLTGRKVLVVGAGEMAELTLGYLVERGAEKVIVANRNLDHARELAKRMGGSAVGLDKLADALAQVDIVISSTAAPGYVITHDMVASARADALGHPLLLVDIALPRDIEPVCAELDDVYCYDLDSLGSIIDEHRQERENEAAKVEKLIIDETDAFLLWLQEREVTPTIKEIYQKAQGTCNREVAHAARELSKIRGGKPSDEELRLLEALAKSVAKKILHGPTIRMRKQVGNPDAYIYTESARFLFGLDNNPLGLPCRHRVEHCRLDQGYPCRMAEEGQCPFGRTMADLKLRKDPDIIAVDLSEDASLA